MESTKLHPGSPSSELLASLRKHLGISQFDLSRRVGISQSSLSRWERSGKGLDSAVVMEIEHLLSGRSDLEQDQLSATSADASSNGLACARIRRSLGMKQQELAGLAGVSRASLSMFENGYLELPPESFEKLLGILQRAVKDNGYDASRNFAERPPESAHDRVFSLHLARFFGEPKHEGLKDLLSQLQTFSDPAFRLGIAERQIESDRNTIQSLTNHLRDDQEKLTRAEAENAEHKKHKQLLSDFAAAQQALIANLNEKILALEHSFHRDVSKELRSIADIDADIMKAWQRVNECHRAILAELNRKTATQNQAASSNE